MLYRACSCNCLDIQQIPSQFESSNNVPYYKPTTGVLTKVTTIVPGSDFLDYAFLPSSKQSQCSESFQLLSRPATSQLCTSCFILIPTQPVAAETGVAHDEWVRGLHEDVSFAHSSEDAKTEVVSLVRRSNLISSVAVLVLQTTRSRNLMQNPHISRMAISFHSTCENTISTRFYTLVVDSSGICDGIQPA